jgi:hypothetical protein
MIRAVRFGVAIGIAGVFAWGLPAVAGDPAASPKADADPAAKRMQRQISIFEKVIDQTLIDSRHALVSGTPNCRGLRLQGYGVLFVVELSPILADDDILHFHFNPDGSYQVEYDDKKDKGRHHTEGRVREQGRRDESDAAEDSSDDSDIEYVEPPSGIDSTDVEAAKKFKNLVKSWDKDSAARLADPERQEVLALVREELVDALRDYGHTLTGIGPDEHIAIAIFPSDLDWRGGPGTRTILQVKRRDVDLANDGQITDEAFASRVEVLTQ